MNPKSPNDLDPKLRETYERVMGASFTPSAQNANQAPQEPQPEPAASSQNEAPLLASEPDSAPAWQAKASEPQPTTQQEDAPVPEPQPEPENQTPEPTSEPVAEPVTNASEPQQQIENQTPEPQSYPKPQSVSEPITPAPITNTPPELVPFPDASALNSSTSTSPQEKKGSKLKPVFLFLGGIIFFAVYAFIWALVFDIL